jgi:predicted unusual protein kinase regulating ubiquinone biosynthesis (AarF/ABC1/UbiB family)
MFNADPHPGNICLDREKGVVGLLDWGQVKTVSDQLALRFALMIQAINDDKTNKLGNSDGIVQAFTRLGVRVSDPSDIATIRKIALTMFDTQQVPGYVLNPFSKHRFDTLMNILIF